MNEINLPKKYINDEITEYIINTHGIDTLNRIISGEILINDRNLNKLIGNPRTFKINVGINVEDFIIENYKSEPTIKFPLSN